MTAARLIGAFVLSLFLCGQVYAVEGTVLRIEGPRFFADLGAQDGLRAGDTVQLLRVVELYDPDQRRQLTDRFSLGEGVVVEVGEVLTLVGAEQAVIERLQLGDVVVAPDRPPPPEPVSVPVPVRGTDSVETGPSPATAAFLGAFQAAARAGDIETRRAIWSGLLEAELDPTILALVQAEAAALDALAQRQRSLEAAARGEGGREELPESDPEPQPLVVIPRALARTLAGRPLQVTITVPQVGRVEHARLFYRQRGKETYRDVVMQPLGDTVLGAEVPASVVEKPGVEWYVVVREHDGSELRMPAEPTRRETLVVRQPEEPGIEDRSQVSLTYDYVDFFRLSGADWFSVFEADFLYRVGAGPLHSFRVGYGVYDGVSGPVQAIDEASAGELDALTSDVGYKYGIAEVELSLSPWLAILPRGIAGVQIDGFALGMGGTLRIGQEEGTSLLVGGLHLGDVGQLYHLQLAWNTVPRVPMSAEVSVTNQPGVSLNDYGVRLVYEARYELTDWVQVGGRVGYQLRNIFHNGPGFGGTVVFAW